MLLGLLWRGGPENKVLSVICICYLIQQCLITEYKRLDTVQDLTGFLLMLGLYESLGRLWD